jgi:hypothetical protein
MFARYLLHALLEIYRVFAVNLPCFCWEFAAFLLGIHHVFARSLLHVLLQISPMFAVNFPHVCCKFAACLLDICCLYCCKFAACLLQFCRVFASIYPEWGISIYRFKNKNIYN